VEWESNKGGENDFFQSVHHTYYNYLFISETILSIKAGVNRPADGYLFTFQVIMKIALASPDTLNSTRPLSWWRSAIPKLFAPSTIIVLAEGLCIPDSTMEVDNSTSYSPFSKAIISSSVYLRL